MPERPSVCTASGRCLAFSAVGLGDKISNRSIIGGLLLMATAGYVLFDGVPQFRLHLLLSLVFGLTMSGFLVHAVHVGRPA